jgi:hypothetical protein
LVLTFKTDKSNTLNRKLNKVQIYNYVFEKEINEKKVFHEKEKEMFTVNFCPLVDKFTENDCY